MELTIKIIQFVASISLLVIIHEFGHFIFARMAGMRVEKFYLFFDPWFSLFKFNWKGTEFGVGWVPFGGYCKIAGMIDESMDSDAMKQPPKPDEFRSKSAGQRLLVMVGGVMMNILLAIGIYIAICYTWGESYLPNTELKNGSSFNELAKEIGFRDGDRILAIDGEQIEDYSDVALELLLREGPVVEVLRGGEKVTVVVDEKYRERMTSSRDFMTPRTPFVIGQLEDGNFAQKGGLLIGDHIVGIDGQQLEFFDQYPALLEANAGDTVNLTVQRDSAGVATLVVLPVQISKEGKIGVDVSNALPYGTRTYTFWQAIPAGLKMTWQTVANYWKQVKMIANPDTGAYKSLGGMMAIGNLFPGVWDWSYFWGITAFISIALAVLNILPLPALDGGHVMFLLWEVVTGRKPSDKFMEVAQTVGMLLLFALIIYANGNDIYRIFIK